MLKISNYELPKDKSKRKYDFIIDTGKKKFVIETNFYGGGGSKLKATAGEYKSLYLMLKNHDINFVWITEGKGWETAKKPLEESFNYIDTILNIKMIQEGILEDILKI